MSELAASEKLRKNLLDTIAHAVKTPIGRWCPNFPRTANLLENAAKYSPPDAPIGVETRAVDGHVVIAVSDRGIGVPEGETNPIFERFHRPKRGEAVLFAAAGTGLSLAIAKGIVEAHGGQIWAERRPEGGVVVRLRLPVGVQ